MSRKSGYKVKDVTGMQNIMFDLKPNRCESEVYMNAKVDVTEFVKFRWNQSAPYSNMCPSDGTASGHCSTGCMAVTTAMIVVKIANG